MNKTTKTSKSSKAKPSKGLKEAPRQRPNESSTRPNDPAPEPNDQTSAERTIAPAERTKDLERDVPTIVADSIPSTIRSDDSSTPSEPEIPRSDRPPNWSLLGRKAVEVMEWLYLEGGFSVSEIGTHFRGLSKSTVYERIRHLVEDPEMRAKHEAARAQFHTRPDPNATQPRPNGEQSYPNAAQSPRSDTTPSQAVDNDGDLQPRQIPRISSEVVVATRPRIEDNNGESSSSTSMDSRQTISSQPVDTDILRLLFQRQPEWLDVFLSIKAASVAAGYQDPIKFFHEQIWKDREDADFFRAAVPHELGDQESLRENFMMIVRQASAYQEAAKKNGLEMRKTVELS